MSNPVPPQPSPAPPPKPASFSRVAIVILVVLLLAGCGCGIPLGIIFLLPAVQVARDASRQQTSMNNLKQIGAALHMYHDIQKQFPPPYIADENGKPTTSWRVLLLPYLEQSALSNEYDFDVAWDEAKNAAVRQTRLPVYQSARDALPPTGTSYVVITGPKTLFPVLGDRAITIGRERERRQMADCTDGTSNTIMVVEIRNSDIEWSEPRDLNFDSLTTDPSAPNSINLAQGALAVFADGEVHRLGPDVTLETLRALLTPAGNEQIRRPEKQSR